MCHEDFCTYIVPASGLVACSDQLFIAFQIGVGWYGCWHSIYYIIHPPNGFPLGNYSHIYCKAGNILLQLEYSYSPSVVCPNLVNQCLILYSLYSKCQLHTKIQYLISREFRMNYKYLEVQTRYRAIH